MNGTCILSALMALGMLAAVSLLQSAVTAALL